MSFVIPPSTLRGLAEATNDLPVAVLLRHSVRPSSPDGMPGPEVPLTDEGLALARELGAHLGHRLVRLHSSPLRRCVETCEAVRAGAGSDVPITHDRMLGDPGVFVADGVLGGETWRRLGHRAVMDHLISGAGTLPGLADPRAAARSLVAHLLALTDRAGVHVFVTHDSIVTAAVARALNVRLPVSEWPRYLEGAFLWRDPRGLTLAYRDRLGVIE